MFMPGWLNMQLYLVKKNKSRGRDGRLWLTRPRTQVRAADPGRPLQAGEMRGSAPPCGRGEDRGLLKPGQWGRDVVTILQMGQSSIL